MRRYRSASFGVVLAAGVFLVGCGGGGSSEIQLASVKSCLESHHAKVTAMTPKGMFAPVAATAKRTGSGGYDVTLKGNQFESAELFFFPSTKAAKTTLPALRKAVQAFPNGAQLAQLDTAFYDQNVLIVFTDRPPEKKFIDTCLPGKLLPLPGTAGA